MVEDNDDIAPAIIEAEEASDKYFQFDPNRVALVRTKDGRKFVTTKYAASGMEGEVYLPGLFLRPESEPDRLIFIPWHNLLSLESEVPVDDE